MQYGLVRVERGEDGLRLFSRVKLIAFAFLAGWLVLSFMHLVRLRCAIDAIHGLILNNVVERSANKRSFP
jgi:hypothetical protein